MLNAIKRTRTTKKLGKGAVVHIFKNKGNGKECANCRPICLLQITYKIWPNLITQRLARILHTLTDTNQYGHKKKRIYNRRNRKKIEQYIEQGAGKQNVLLTDLSKAFGAVNRTILWNTLYKQGVPVQAILHIRRGHNKTILQAKHNKQYGGNIHNNIGV